MNRTYRLPLMPAKVPCLVGPGQPHRKLMPLRSSIKVEAGPVVTTASLILELLVLANHIIPIARERIFTLAA